VCIQGDGDLMLKEMTQKVPVKLKTFVELTRRYFFEARILYGNGNFPVSLGTPLNGSSSGV